MHKRTFLHAASAAALTSLLPTIAWSQVTPTPTQRPTPGPLRTLTGTDSAGKPVMLKDFAGKVCLISFFTTGCALCTHELRLMREFYMGNRDKDFVLLGVVLDEKREDFMHYIEVLNLSVPTEQRFPIAWRFAPGHQDNFGPIARKPTHFVLDRQHRQVLRREGSFQPTDWDDLWTSLL